jgi:flavin-binding protein dodecin
MEPGAVLGSNRRFSGRKYEVLMAKKAASEESVYNVVEVIGTSEQSWEDAARNAVETASKTLGDLRIAEVIKMDMKVENGKSASTAPASCSPSSTKAESAGSHQNSLISESLLHPTLGRSTHGCGNRGPLQARKLPASYSTGVYAAKAGRGEKVKWDELDAKDYKTKAAVVALLEKAVADSEAVLKSVSDEALTKSIEPWLGVLQHSSEHPSRYSGDARSRFDSPYLPTHLAGA